MFEIYILSHFNNMHENALKRYFLMNSIISTLRLILYCLVNGKVFDESDKLYVALNDINSTNDIMFKEVINFRTLCLQLPNGFTIGGLMPLRRTTLLSVKYMFSNPFQLSNNHFPQIFSFILTYSIILIQTGGV